MVIHLRGQLAPQLPEACTNPGLDGAERNPEFGRDFLVGQVLEEGQVHCLSLGPRQFPARRPHDRAKRLAPRQLLRPGPVVGQARKKQTIGIGLQSRTVAPPPEFVQDPKVGDLQQPGPESPPLRRENRSIPPHRQEDIPNDLLSGAVIQRVRRRGENQRAYRLWSRPSDSCRPEGS